MRCAYQFFKQKHWNRRYIPASLWVGLGTALLLLLLLLLLLYELALLHFFHYLLGSTDGAVGTKAWPSGDLRLRRLNGGLWLLFWLVLSVVVLILLRTIKGSLCASIAAVLARAEHDLPRRSVTDVSSEQDVVSGTLQELGEHVACLTGTVDSVDALVRAHTFHFCSRLSRDLAEDLLEAGVGCIDAKSRGIPYDGRGARLVVHRPIRHGWRRRGFGDRLLVFRLGVGVRFWHLRLLRFGRCWRSCRLCWRLRCA
jgi:hypothetical protein